MTRNHLTDHTIRPSAARPSAIRPSAIRPSAARPRRASKLLAAAALALTTAATAVSLGAAPASAANSLGGARLYGSDSGRCAPMTSNSVAGTLLGADGMALNATIGMDFKDAHGNAIDATTGCAASGYGALVQLNHYIGADGAAVGSPMTVPPGRFSPARSAGTVDPTFGVYNLPANAVTVYVETYTRRFTGSPCGLVCAGVTDNSKYGNVNRQQLRVGGATSNLALVAAETPAFHGVTGSIQVYIHSLNVSQLHAWSMSIKGNIKDEGWGTGIRSTTNPHLWTIPALSPGQDYTMIASGYPQQYHIKVSKRHQTKVTERF